MYEYAPQDLGRTLRDPSVARSPAHIKAWAKMLLEGSGFSVIFCSEKKLFSFDLCAVALGFVGMLRDLARAQASRVTVRVQAWRVFMKTFSCIAISNPPIC